MICHEYKAIFIHIPRTGGTSIEHALIGKDYWEVDPLKKHQSACQVRKECGEKIWSEYFKFSFVRNPWDRMISLWKEGSYGKEKTLYEFLLNFKPASHEYPSPQYSAILNERLDYIGRFERLEDDYEVICKRIGRCKEKLPKINAQVHEHYSVYYNVETKVVVDYLCKGDIQQYGYEFKSLKNNVFPRCSYCQKIFYVIKFIVLRGLKRIAWSKLRIPWHKL